MINLEKTQTYMRAQAIDGWLIFDFRANNPVLAKLLGRSRPTSRRNYLYIPAQGHARLLVHQLDKSNFQDADLPTAYYTSWPQMHTALRGLLAGSNRVAMEYSPGGAIPMHSWVDAGTVELIRSLGVEVVSSANLFQIAAAAWSEPSIASHQRACQEVDAVKEQAFDFIRAQIRAGRTTTEHEVQGLILAEFERRGLVIDHGPIVAVGPHSGDPHYEPSPDRPTPIGPEAWVLIDLWAKYPGDHDVYADITWVGYTGANVPPRYQEVFNIVKGARDGVVAHLQRAWHAGERLQGWQLDQVARDHITQAGYGDFFVHRTGHSMGPSPSPHALGVNLDNLETHDTREILPGVGFSVEPGIYLPEFGVRSEINVLVHPQNGPIVTTRAQDEILILF